MKPLTGPELFLHYAWPCAEIRLRSKLISEDDFKRLKSFLKNKENIDIDFLTACFPKAVASLKEYKNGTDCWSFESVSDYWRNGHKGTGDCAVKHFIVFEIRKRRIVFVGLKHPVINEYNFELKVGDHILVHHKRIIEKI